MHDFEAALETFGITALLSRSIQLCKAAGCPKDFLEQLLDFRTSWQWVEIGRIRKRNKDLDRRAAFNLYILCSLLRAPDQLPKDKLHADKLLQGPTCSPWASVIARSGLGAFKDP